MKLILLLLSALISISASAQSYVNVLLYHHVADDTPFATTTKIADFTAHLNYLEQNEFTVVDIVDAINRLKAGEPLPEKSVAIVFDDAFVDIYHNALPLLTAKNMPFSIFIATEPVDKKYPGMLSWAQLKEMHALGVSMLNHTTDHAYLIHDQSEGWLERVISNIEAAQTRLAAELGVTERYLAYPFGEFNDELKEALAQRGYVAFGQHSGGISATSDFLALPRFPAAGHYAKLSTLKTKLNSRPLPLEDYQTENMQALSNPPEFRFKPAVTDFHRPFFQCFIEGEAVKPEWLETGEAVVIAAKKLNAGRSRYNCTVPSPKGGYYWISQPWLIARANGSYPKQ